VLLQYRRNSEGKFLPLADLPAFEEMLSMI
jgi:hypothetical protein